MGVTADEELGMSIMVHPKPHQISVGEIGGILWLDLSSAGYTSVSIRLTPEVSQAIVDALAPYALASVAGVK